MEALWDTVSHGSEQAALVAFRILGKFGGSNRKMLNEPPKVMTLVLLRIVQFIITLPF